MSLYYIDDINKTVNFSFKYDKDLKERFKNSDRNARYNSESKEWIVPINEFTKAFLVSIIKEYGFEKKTIKTEEVSYSYKKSAVDYAYLKGLCDAKGFTYMPRDYQLEALGYAMDKGSFINGDSPGLGKTFESIMYAETTNSFPCLVITPSSVKYNWQEKWLEITDNKRTVSVIESSPKKNSPNDWSTDVVVINYDILGKKSGKSTLLKFDELKNIPWEMIICDEGHFLKEKTSQRSKAVKKIIGKKDIIVQLLTGTAVMSKPVEIWNLLKLIKKDHLIAKDWFQFIKRYCGGYMGKFGWVTDGATNLFEFNKALRDNCYIRRELKEVLKELPESIREVIQIPITNIRKITLAQKDFLKYIEDEKGVEAAESASEAEHLVALGEFRRLAIQGKVKGIEQYLNDWKIVNDSKLLIFGIHEEPLSILAKKYGSPLINGKTSAKRKQEIVKEWQNNDDLFLFANGDAAGTGVDGLQNVCSNMIIIELPWRTSDLAQWTARLHRSGQKSAVNIKFLLNFKTIDLQMWNMLALKERVTEGVNKGKDALKSGSAMKTVLKEILKKSK